MGRQIGSNSPQGVVTLPPAQSLGDVHHLRICLGVALAAFTREWTKDKQQRRAERERDLAAKQVEAGKVGVVDVT